MKAAELDARLQVLIAEHLGYGYEPDEALPAAHKCIVYEALAAAAGKDELNTHEYWNTDTDYFVDLWKMPRPIVLQRLEDAAVAVKAVTGIDIHICDCT